MAALQRDRQQRVDNGLSLITIAVVRVNDYLLELPSAEVGPDQTYFIDT
jgi:hypothetical protein